MRDHRFILVCLIIVSSFAVTGCEKGSPAQPTVTGNTNASSPSPEASTGPTASAPPKILGNYVMSEVQHEGQVTMVDQAMATEFNFLADGNYTRQSKRNGRIDHSDSGQFSVEGSDQLVLRIQLSDNKIQIPPVEKKLTITVSAEGDEIALKGSEGKVAVFRRKSGSPQ